MIKDLSQKQKAVRFCVATGMIPYMEVVVRYVADVADAQSDISDVDVLGLRATGLQPQKKVIFDCKTQNKVSAINRALWATGLLKLIGGSEGYVILNKPAPEGHRLAANSLGIRVTSEKLFDEFGKSTSPSYFEGSTYLDNLAAWEWIHGISKANANLEELVSFLLNDAPLSKDATAGFRNLISRMRRAEGELDAGKSPHLTLWGLMLCETLRFLSEICTEFQHIFDPAMEKSKFESLLRNFIWGGKESYLIRNKLHSALRSNKSEEEAGTFELPGWPRFIEMTRGFLDAPHLISSSILPLKDLSFRLLCEPSELADKRIKIELTANSRVRQFILSANKYLGNLSPHFRECADHYNKIITTF